MLILVMRDLRVRNDQLSEARAELARLAVAEERERFARDLHDLLGHSLSVIALKAELAGRLLPDRAERGGARGRRARERRARGAERGPRRGQRLPPADARRRARGRADGAVRGRDPRRRRARADATLDPTVEAVLAWAVREGATNVIRHSGASHCTLTVSAGLADAGVEVVDDGVGAARLGQRRHGRQRARRGSPSAPGSSAGGSRRACVPGGGYRLAVHGAGCRRS